MSLNLDTLGPDICLSGGADGADLQFGMCAGMIGHTVIHFSFAGCKSNAPEDEIVLLTKEQLADADAACMRANQILKRTYPPKSMKVRNLLRRDYYQVAWSESVYAVSKIKEGLIEGGTGWAVIIFLQRFNLAPCPCYVFCQEAGFWYEWKGHWEKIYSPPKPSGIWAGIGSRDLQFIGKLAIRVLMDYQKPSKVHD